MQDRAGLTCTMLTVPPPTAGRGGKAAFQNSPSIISIDGCGTQPAGLAHPSTCQKWMQKVSNLFVFHGCYSSFITGEYMCGQAQQLHKGKPCVVQVRRAKALCVSCAEKGPIKSTGETSSMKQVLLLS